MTNQEIIEIEKRWRAGYGVNLQSWQNGKPCELSDTGYFLAHDVPAMIAALKHSADNPSL